MPTYEYECEACHHKFEELQRFSEAPLKKCPKCKKPKLQRLLGTGAAVLFKGSGFYETDYRSDSYKKAASADSAPPPAADKPAADSAAGSTGVAAPAAEGKSAGESKPKGKTPKSKS